MAQINQSICLTLPKSITKQISTCENSEQYITNFLQNALPSSDIGSVADELRKSLIFAKHKNKWNKKKRCQGKLLTSRKRMQLGLRKISCKSDMKYTALLPLNQLWLNYMEQVLGSKFFNNIPKDSTDPNWENVNQQLIKADFHGAEISIVGSKCPSLIGLSGIVIQDTKNIFRICGRDNIMRTIPKDNVIINIYLKNIKLEFFGKDLCIRPTERTIKKFKCGRIYEL
ncbi:ribonuclease P protein subunit p29 [Bombus pascuorum]|uniref:ribonuclease P protein subunit p29 n=1 Tax=Bombus pascuorum TaxID=65598 RepID=UPI00212493F1|nr:ribonuclease P protein subunit p29 [Bombus pascuorum]XP_060821757.1 ribonuclease P protein subunit p29 [Bombus pascuorum]XP_060821759.1 ribonuclease P protein subunit p29 [Bombus pascuorum]